jgi:hypothetical protein
MRILNLTVELHGNKEVSLNGKPLIKGKVEIDEKVIFQQLNLDQQWFIICELKKTLNMLNSTYQRSRVKSGEISMDDYDQASLRIKSAGDGVAGTTIGKLRNG